MIATVIPLKRLPRGLNMFDYTVPEDLTKDIRIGQLVEIPFRKSTIFGLIFSIEEKDNDTLKEIVQLYNPEPVVHTAALDTMQSLSNMYGTAIGTIAKMALLPPQKRKIKKAEFTALPKSTAKKTTEKPSYHHCTNQDEHKTMLHDIISGTTLIIVPEVHLIQEVSDLLPNPKNAISWHSKLSTKEKFEHWLAIRNQEKTIIVGTRGAALLAYPKLDTIIIDFEHDENQKHWDQAPRFHTKDVAALLAKNYNANLHLASFSPSADAYFHVHKKQYNGAFNLNTESPTIVNMADERRGRNFGVFGNKTEEALLDATGDVFIFVNRRGFATSVGCNDCGHIEECATCKNPLIFHQKTRTLHCHYCTKQQAFNHSCAKCNSPIVELRGAGTEFVDAEVRHLIGSKKQHRIKRIDGDVEQIIMPDGPTIIVGTQKAFPYIRWSQTELIVFLDIDKVLNRPEYLAQENAWHLMHEVQYRKQPDAQFLIQTHSPEQIAIRSLREPDRYYRTDLNARSGTGYPPYAYLVRYFVGKESAEAAKKEADRVYAEMKKLLTTEQKNSIIRMPIEMHPRYFRKKYWQCILVSLPKDNWQQALTSLNRIIPNTWKIDPNPISILSP